MNLKALGIEKLSIDERIELVEEIWDSIAADASDLPLTVAQQSDLRRRLAEHRAEPQSGSTWEEIRRRLQNRK